MRVDSFDFELPERLIATEPLANRDASRMLVVDEQGAASDHYVRNVAAYLKAGDVLVLNDAKVMNARLFGKRGEGRVELLIHQHQEGAATHWLAFAKPAKRLKPGDEITLEGEHVIEVLDKREDGQLLLDMRLEFAELVHYLEQHGHVPLPPYIQKHRGDQAEDKSRYQTIFANDQKQRSVAAPTAGLHFTDALLAELEGKGVAIVHITLHVGAGTFLPVKVDDTDDHIMHSEYWEVSEMAAATINQAKQAGGRVVAVGTTSLRTLESAAENGAVKAGHSATDLFITPGYQFKLVDVLLTNFHLPKSTLFMLVSAFSGTDVMKAAYAHAMEQDYRFYSYGDACLLHRHIYSISKQQR